jgi:dienelactone hydrolase
MKKIIHLTIGILGLLAFFFSVFQVQHAKSGLDIIRTKAGDLPLEIIAPRGSSNGSRPLVLIGHGFAGSGVIMRGFAYTLAKAGYVAAVWDFDGHAANPRPLPEGMLRGDLLPNAEAALAEVQRLGVADPQRVAILGHSMGSGVALSFGQAHPETKATIAVSPVATGVTPKLPLNLLLMAGSREPAFLRNAQSLLAQAGGAGGDPVQGTGRMLFIIPGVEHVTIVLSPTAHKEARGWLDSVFGAQPGAVDYTDRRSVWYAIGVLGILLAALMLVPATRPSGLAKPRPLWRRLVSLAAGALSATLILWLLSSLKWIPSNLFGMLVGGYLLIWFAIAGVIALLGLNLGSSWAELGWPGFRTLVSGLLVAAALWLGVGLLGGQVWLPWLLIPSRLALWPLALICMLPWHLAAGQAQNPASGWGRLGWWVFQVLVVVGSLFLALQLIPSLFFLMLILPIFPLMMGAHALAAGRQRHAWAYALSAALFIGWAILAVFPLAA